MLNDVFILPTPKNISSIWNFGFLLGIIIIFQIISGLLVALFYNRNINFAFKAVMIIIIEDVNYGGLIRIYHINGASFIFLLLYLHIGRGIYYRSFNKLTHVWISGVIIYLICIAVAFLGYVLPWGQIRYWGATVITNLFSAIPYCGLIIVEFLWGRFGVSNNTLIRFYILHFLLPFLIIGYIIIHLIYLHLSGSSNRLNNGLNKIKFSIFFSVKDSIYYLSLLRIIIIIIFYSPYYLSDSENFIEANSIVTPVHIKPEWYYLWAYAILRSVPNKLGGVLLLFGALGILFFLPVLNLNYRLTQNIFWRFIRNFLLLTWIGGNLVEFPYIQLGGIFTFRFYLFLIIIRI